MKNRKSYIILSLFTVIFASVAFSDPTMPAVTPGEFVCRKVDYDRNGGGGFEFGMSKMMNDVCDPSKPFSTYVTPSVHFCCIAR